MPSLLTNNRLIPGKVSTFHEMLPSRVYSCDHDSDETSRLCNHKEACLFVTKIILTLMISAIIFQSADWTILYIQYSHAESVYIKHNLYFIGHVATFCRSTIILSWLLYYYILNDSKIWIVYKLIIFFIITVVSCALLIIGLIIISDKYYSLNFGDLFNNYKICKYWNCDLITVSNAYWDIGIYSLYYIIILTCVYGFIKCITLCTTHIDDNYNSKSRDVSQNEQNESSQLSVLTEITTLSWTQIVPLSKNIDKPMATKSKHGVIGNNKLKLTWNGDFNHSLWINMNGLYWMIIWFLAFSTFFLCFFCMETAEFYVFRNFFEYWYYSFLAACICAKYLLKRIARQIDICTIKFYHWMKAMFNNDHGYSYSYSYKCNYNSQNYNTTVDEHPHLMSFEIFCEIFVSYFYWGQYRFYVAFFLPSWKIFIRTMIVHLISEIGQSGIRSSKVYFNYSMLFENWIKQRQSRIIKFVANKIVNDDDCTFNQWKIRCSIDVMIRIIISAFTAIPQLALILCFYHNFYNYNDTQTYFKAISYNLISLSTEIIYFGVIIIVNLKYNQFNIIKPLIYLSQQPMRKSWFITLWIIPTLLGAAFLQ